MGQAKRRGTFEMRKAQAIMREDALHLARIAELKKLGCSDQTISRIGHIGARNSSHYKVALMTAMAMSGMAK